MMDRLYKTMGSVVSVPGTLLKWSDDFRSFYSSGYRCPKCSKRLIGTLGVVTLEFYDESGTRVPVWQGGPLRADSAGCPKCGYRFKIKVAADPGPVVTPPQVTILETERREEPIGTDTTLIDNSQSAVTVRRTISVTKEWSRSYSIEKDTSQTGGVDFDIGLPGAGSLKATCESTLSNKYVNSESHRDVYAETIGVDVPGSTSLRLMIEWKNIVQLGFVEIRTSEQSRLVPFRAVVGVTFDQKQIDGAS